eukprot:5228780-Pyramimonas_sp.AAC.1
MTQPNNVSGDTAVLEVAAATPDGLKGKMNGKAQKGKENRSNGKVKAPEVPPPALADGPVDVEATKVANGDSNGSAGEDAPTVEDASGSENAAKRAGAQAGEESEAGANGKPQRQRSKQRNTKEQKAGSEDPSADPSEGPAESTGAEKDGEEKKEKEV